ncbi:Leucine-rich repeat transmembrane protein FLRT1 [Nibea albiflora]|uniref:Leucine-rich repeat transmembrane protein FLRT1 n=1 Tax=Nibea albiflora TaxID=240163 RepID=A0ACB7F1E2_NIBAL|nr:Leucine-rich repeat transmembrane protein FLRT1 [Nibea albiflora]
MRRLQRLDLSGNNLTTLPRGLFKDLESLGQLLVRGNPWHCGCNLRWLYDWLHARGNSITVRGLTCHGPDRVRDMALTDLTTEMEECERPGLGLPDSGLDYTLSSSGVGKSLALNVKPLSHNSVRVTWSVAQPSSSFRLSWLRLGIGNAMGSITETLVRVQKAKGGFLEMLTLMNLRTGHLCPRDHYTRSSSRKSKTYDDYIESGTKKDNTILEIRGPGFQMTPMAACQPMQPKPLREDYIIHTIFPSNGTGLYKGANHVSNAGHGTNRGYREGGIPDIDYCYT